MKQKILEKAEKYNFDPLLDVEPGSIIRIHRDDYDYYHYGIYSGNNEVIHYEGSLFSKKEVSKTKIHIFLEGRDGCEFIDVKGGFSNEESLRRANSFIGKKSYNLLFNNCEHFAMWCKTGKRYSSQVNFVLVNLFFSLLNTD